MLNEGIAGIKSKAITNTNYPTLGRCMLDSVKSRTTVVTEQFKSFIPIMRLFVSAWSLRDTIQKRGLTLTMLPKFVQQHGFQSLELSDRQLSTLTIPELEHFSETAQQLNCDLIVNIGCDLTLADVDRRQAEINHVLSMLQVAEVLRAASVRICLGGQ